jgi:hypothetical protein
VWLPAFTKDDTKPARSFFTIFLLAKIQDRKKSPTRQLGSWGHDPELCMLFFGFIKTGV